MGLSAAVRGLAFAALACGCAAIAGLEPPDPIDAGDASVASPNRAPEDATAPPPPPDEADASDVSDASCVAEVSPIPKSPLHAPAWVGPAPAIDGRFDEWACLSRVELGPGDYTSQAYPTTDKGTFVVRWTPEMLYVFAIVETESPGYTDNTRYLNDSISIYVGPPGTPSVTYREGDWRLVFDHQGFSAAYQDGYARPFPAAVTWKSTSTTKNDTIVARHEIAIAPALLGLTSFSKGTSYLFGLQVSDQVSTGTQYRIWERGSTCGCTQGCCYAGNEDHPSCDARCNGSLVLD